MKKLFISIVALAAFAACQSNFDDVTTNTPGFDNGANSEGLVEIYAEVGVGGETKATYGDDMSAMWEENDQIALVQESANYNSVFNYVNALDIKRGAGTSSAAFWGDVTVPTESPRIYHIAYPVSAVSASTNMSVTKSGDSSYSTKGTSAGMAHYAATANYKYEYTSTLNVSVPTSQSGKWEPYMYASTPEAVSANGIRATHLTTLTGAIAVRAYEADGTTPKKLAKVTISSANNAIAGAFTGHAISATTISVTGDYTSDDYSTVSDGDVGPLLPGRTKGKAAADALLEEKAKSTVPTTVSNTQSMSLAFAGTAKSVTVENANVAADANGDYIYYINVAPFAGEKITIQAVAEDGTSLIRTIPSATLAASQRMRVKLTWEKAGLTNGSVETWYDSYADNHSTTLAGSKVYVNNVVVEGVEASAVSAIGALVYDLNGNLVAQNISANNTLSLSQVVVDVPTSGTYTVMSYAKVTVNGEERDLTGEAKKVNVTSIPTDASLIQSSYSRNGTAKPTNDIGGTALECTPALSDSTIPANLISSCQFVYGSTTVNATYKDKKSVSLALGQYNCYVKIVLGNGYVCQSGTYATHITGIPFTMTTTSNADGWSTSGTISWNTDGGVRLGKNQTAGSGAYIQRSFHIPSDILVKVTANGTVSSTYKVENKATVSVGSTTVCSQSVEGNNGLFGVSTASFSCSAASASMSASNNSVKCNSSYNMAGACVVIKALTIQY